MTYIQDDFTRQQQNRQGVVLRRIVARGSERYRTFVRLDFYAFQSEAAVYWWDRAGGGGWREITRIDGERLGTANRPLSLVDGAKIAGDLAELAVEEAHAHLMLIARQVVEL